MKKAPARSEKSIVVDELVDDQVFAITDWADIRPSYTNRKRFNQTALEQLAANIKEVGIVQPILIRPVTPTTDAPQHFEIVAGERRWRAGNIAKLQRGPTMIRKLTDLQAREIQLLENLQREDPHPMEEAEGFQELMLNAGYTADRLVEKLKKSRSHIYGRLKLCALTTEVREKFLDDAITPSTALLIARIPVPALQIKALGEISATIYQGTGEPMPYRAALRHVQQNYMVDLTRALFKLTDATLLPLAGACSKCPKKTGNQPEVFSDTKSADVCTDPVCYAEKRLAHDALAIAAAGKSGIPIYEGEEGATQYRRNTNSKYTLFVKADAALWMFDRNAPATQNYGNATMFLEGGLLPEPAWYVKHDNGDLTPFYDKALIQKLLEDAGACETVEVHAARMADVRAIAEKKEAEANTPAKQADVAKVRAEEAAAEKQAAQDERYRIELYKRLRAKGANGFSLASLREFTKLALTTHELPDQALTYQFDTSTTESIHAYIDQAGLPDVQLLLVDMLMGDCLATDGWFDEDDSADQVNAMHAMARHEGLDPDAVRLQLEMDAIPFEDVQAQQLADFIAHAPGRLNDLTKVILAERPLMIKALEQAANTHGWYYAPGQVWLRAGETSTPNAAHAAPEQSDDEDADDLADQINLSASAQAAETDPHAAVAVDLPEPVIEKPAAWPWPTSATTLPTTAKVAQ
ncbi:hypothetical protein BA896_012600 [Janthinobacterium lividum]|uniref:ParB-like N-terminal domain-containing protein n=1 Tax=Janthinobacterium lividum TaxID=29581 RepID=A0A1E8PVD3_9BURK|nr:hypothetical protein BA896_012600 [Janthinobacterium lividum]